MDEQLLEYFKGVTIDREDNFFRMPILIEDNPSIHKDPAITYFVFPFDKKDMPPEKAYEEIASKLENLTFPLLFLNNLNAIICEYGGKQVLYDRVVKEEKTIHGTKCELIDISETNGSTTDIDRLWLFTRNYISTLKYSMKDTCMSEKSVQKQSF